MSKAYNISLSCYAETREEAIARFKDWASTLDEGGWPEQLMGSGGGFGGGCVSIGSGRHDFFSEVRIRLDKIESKIDAVDERL